MTAETENVKVEKLIIVGAIPKKDMPEIGYEKGVYKSVRVLKTLCNRFQIFKDSKHYHEMPGQKVYDTIEAMEEDFVLEREIRTV